MARINVPRYNQPNAPKTHEGAPAKFITPEQQLRRSVMSCMLWEDTFYEDGVSISDRISELIHKVDPNKVSEMAIEARTKMKLRHVPLLMVREMARAGRSARLKVAETLSKVVQRPDELTEFLAIYWKDGRQPLSAQVKKGLAQAFVKFNGYQLAKYNRDGAVKLRDVLFLSHAKPLDEAQAKIWEMLVKGELEPPDTWEVNLSAGEDKKTTWTRLLKENRLGGLALLRNLRNMQQVGVDGSLIIEALQRMRVDIILPFRFISAERYAPHLAEYIENALFNSIRGRSKLAGKTLLLVDSSASMQDRVSGKSQITRWDAAVGVAILCRELCERVIVYDFAGEPIPVPNRRGFALRDVIRKPHNGTNLDDAVICANEQNADRIICITDEQSHQRVRDPNCARAYIVNVASYQNGVGYGKWTHIDGWSESILDYISTVELQ